MADSEASKAPESKVVEQAEPSAKASQEKAENLQQPDGESGEGGEPSTTAEASPGIELAQGRGHIDVDSSNWDSDSALGEDGGSTGSASITSSIQDYRYENGRRYHAYRDGKYLLPNDEMEQDRLDLHHHIFRLTLGGKLYRSPLVKGEVGRVLDYGCGTGIWAMDFADEHPESTVIGIDLSPIQPNWTPTNCSFYVDDVEGDWVYADHEAFDFIHGRSMGGSISSWPELFNNIYAHLKPGAWVENQDYQAIIYSQNDPNLIKAPNVNRWQQLINEGMEKIGKPLHVAPFIKGYMIDAGFTNVTDEVYQVPIGPWPKNKKLKEIGTYHREHMVLCVDAFTLALFTRVLGWTNEETQVIMAQVKKEFRDPSNQLMTIFHYTFGQKPHA